MDKNDFKRWRKSLNLSQKDAAHKLGLKRRVVQYYEKGERDGKKVEIPLSVRLACWAIAEGQEDYHGPAKRREKAKPGVEDASAALQADVTDAPADAVEVNPAKPTSPDRKPSASPRAKKAAVTVEPSSD